MDHDQSHNDALLALLTELGHVAVSSVSPLRALEIVAAEPFDVVVTHLAMTEMDSMEFFARLHGTQPDIPIVVLTGQGSMDAVIRALRAGAYDFLTKPVDPSLLAACVARAAAHRRLRIEVQQLRRVVSTRAPQDGLVGASPALEQVRDLVGRVARSDASVLICGETGTGKELVARALHGTSERSSNAFVAINCAAIPSNLLESELFGHVRGAFTDARSTRRGLFVAASGGTLFLDEIAEMEAPMQTKLLRVLQERTVRPVGADSDVAYDARIVSATHRDLEKEVESGRFRQDLYFRINVVKITVPTLRERRADILSLAELFLARATARSGKAGIRISPEVAERLLAYHWPGNVRELENCIEGAVALARFTDLTIEDLPEKIRAYRSDAFVMIADEAHEIVSLETLEQRYITRVIKIVGGNKARAATLLGLDRRTLYRRLERYGLES
ncbi:MAG: sigma-54-dependent Fis family transcriptional regulator [Myxococcales bacterium]|nr:sigma-54-dependent Fis family transcriptional regulator [Myxococcales bacterium]